MKTFEELFRAQHAGTPEFRVNDALVKGANGEYWNAQVRHQYEWFKTGQAQNMAMLKVLKSTVSFFLDAYPEHSEELLAVGLTELLADVEEVLKNEQA